MIDQEYIYYFNIGCKGYRLVVLLQLYVFTVNSKNSGDSDVVSLSGDGSPGVDPGLYPNGGYVP